MAREGMRDVVLSDDEGPGGGEDALSGGAGEHPRPDVSGAPTAEGLRPRTTRWWLLGLCLAVALAATVVPAIRARMQEARLAPVLGVLSPLEPPLEPIWTGPVGLGLEEMTGELLVALFPAADGYEVVGMDSMTGDRLWAAPLPPGVTVEDSHCRILRHDPHRPPEQVVCHVVTPLGAGVERLPYGPGAEQRLLVLDPTTGETRAERSLGFGYVVVMPVGADVVVSQVLADGRAQMTREDPVDGRERWRFRSDDPLPGAGEGAGPRAPFPVVEHDVVVLEGPATWALDADDGRVLGTWDGVERSPSGLPSVVVQPLPDGRLAVGRPAAPERGDVYGHIVDADGERAFPIDGPALATLVDDRSAADVLFTYVLGRNDIVALDAETGVRRWSMPANAGTLPLVLERRLVTTVGQEVVAVDAGSGRRLWTALRGEVRTNDALMPDGRVALVPRPDDRADGVTLTAVRLTDGRVEWSLRPPAHTFGYIEAGGHLFALHRARITRLS